MQVIMKYLTAVIILFLQISSAIATELPGYDPLESVIPNVTSAFEAEIRPNRAFLASFSENHSTGISLLWEIPCKTPTTIPIITAAFAF